MLNDDKIGADELRIFRAKLYTTCVLMYNANTLKITANTRF